MIRKEEFELEEYAIRSGCIAVPFVCSVTADGGVECLVYSFVEKAAREWEDRFIGDPFSAQARAFLHDKLDPVMMEIGFETEWATEHTHLEYRTDAVCREAVLPFCTIIDSLEGERADGVDLEDFELDPTCPADRMAVIRNEQGAIVCFAGVNDMDDEDGCAEITVECGEAYRQRGYGASCVALLTEYLQGIGEEVKYVCRSDHKISAKTAEAAGFKLYREKLSFVCYRREEEKSEMRERKEEVIRDGV